MAKSLSYSAVEQIKQTIASQIDHKIALKISIDPSLGCGFIAHWEGRVHDFSLLKFVDMEHLKRQCF